MPLTLYPDSQLYKHDGDAAQYRDVSMYAHQFLFEPVSLDDSVLLCDIVGLLLADPLLKSIYAKFGARELATYLRSLSTQTRPGYTGVYGETDIPFDFLELRQVWFFNSNEKRYFGLDDLSLKGVTRPSDGLEAALIESGITVPIDSTDGFIKQPVGRMPLTHILDLPVAVSPLQLELEGDMKSLDFNKPINLRNASEVTLGVLLHSVLRELADAQLIPGVASPCEPAMSGFGALVDAAESEFKPAMLVSAATYDPERVLFFDVELYGRLTKCFTSLGGVNPSLVHSFLCELADDSPVAIELADEFGALVKLAAVHQHSTAKELRRAIMKGSECEKRVGS